MFLALTKGLSPRVRGNLVLQPHFSRILWSIPACAGEPQHSGNWAFRYTVYPRVCGGTPAKSILSTSVGLSRSGEPSNPNRSIAPVYPACAGTTQGLRKYPAGSSRVCGDRPCLTPYAPASLIPACAGEPRNLNIPGHTQVYPACAGEPRASYWRFCCIWSIPRVRGTAPAWVGDGGGGSIPVVRGNQGWKRHVKETAGLSPRVRGNLIPTDAATCHARSIPACAGEPRQAVTESAGRQVYPRVCGGTWLPANLGNPSQGLSPRVRGNPAGIPGICRIRRSIPACAGEPVPSKWPIAACGVYPRVCGGTGKMPTRRGCATGLSPRVRGNRPVSHFGDGVCGSIPACAGEPARSHFGDAFCGSIPRVRGKLRRCW